MTNRSGPIYESRVFVEPEALAEFDTWLDEQVVRARRTAGVVDVVAFGIGPDARDRPGRVCQFTLDDDEALEGFVDGLATELEAAALDRFGASISWQERILREDEFRELPAGSLAQIEAGFNGLAELDMEKEDGKVLKGIKERKLPNLDDDFAKTLGDFNTVEELKESIRKHLEAFSLAEVKRNKEQKIREKLLADNDLCF